MPEGRIELPRAQGPLDFEDTKSRSVVEMLLIKVMPYGIKCHMAAKLVYREKFIYDDGAIREMVLWQISKKSAGKPYSIKYRLYYGLSDGTCIIRYDNERGKGDHRHFKDKEAPYKFKNVENLVAGFLADIATARRVKNEKED